MYRKLWAERDTSISRASGESQRVHCEGGLGTEQRRRRSVRQRRQKTGPGPKRQSSGVFLRGDDSAGSARRHTQTQPHRKVSLYWQVTELPQNNKM